MLTLLLNLIIIIYAASDEMLLEQEEVKNWLGAANIPPHNPNMMTINTTTETLRQRRTTPERMTFKEECNYLAKYCLKAFDTGKICGRSIYYKYQTFPNYCLLDYANCMERYDTWQLAHMGECFNISVLPEYLNYPYIDDHFLDHYYVLDF